MHETADKFSNSTTKFEKALDRVFALYRVLIIMTGFARNDSSILGVDRIRRESCRVSACAPMGALETELRIDSALPAGKPNSAKIDTGIAPKAYPQREKGRSCWTNPHVLTYRKIRLRIKRLSFNLPNKKRHRWNIPPIQNTLLSRLYLGRCCYIRSGFFSSRECQIRSGIFHRCAGADFGGRQALRRVISNAG